MKDYSCPWNLQNYSYASVLGCKSKYHNTFLLNLDLKKLCENLDSHLSDSEISYEKMEKLARPFLKIMKDISQSAIIGEEDVVDNYEYNPAYFWLEIWNVMFFHYQKNTENLEKIRKVIEPSISACHYSEFWK